jgi:hypothetical protein
VWVLALILALMMLALMLVQVLMLMLLPLPLLLLTPLVSWCWCGCSAGLLQVGAKRKRYKTLTRLGIANVAILLGLFTTVSQSGNFNSIALKQRQKRR